MKTGEIKSEGFEAISWPDARVLILGTLPGRISLECGQYYAQPRNMFWPIMGEIVGGVPTVGAVPTLEYESRKSKLQQNGIALWDVCAAGHRSGSLDSAIRYDQIEPNNFRKFFSTHANICLICFNGTKAEKIYRRLVVPGLPSKFRHIRMETLPSTSPAYAAMSFEKKVSRWRAVLSCNP